MVVVLVVRVVNSDVDNGSGIRGVNVDDHGASSGYSVKSVVMVLRVVGGRGVIMLWVVVMVLEMVIVWQ